MQHRVQAHPPPDSENGYNRSRPAPATIRSPENTSWLPAILEVLFLFALIAALCLLPTTDGHVPAPQASANTAASNGDNPR